MNDFTAKVKITPQVLDFLKEYSVSSELLTPLVESFWKPKGVNLKDFPPGKKVIRLRALEENLEKASADELNTFLKDGSYTHDKINLLKGSLKEVEVFLEKQGYERWVEIKLRSTEYKIELPSGSRLDALEEEINDKKTIVKFEAENETQIKEVMKLIGLTPQDLILKNRAELLAEKMGPI